MTYSPMQLRFIASLPSHATWRPLRPERDGAVVFHDFISDEGAVRTFMAVDGDDLR